MRPGVFLDRDGTINEEIGYLFEPERLVLIKGAAEAIKRLNDFGLICVCISNQSGVARGYYPIEAVEMVHRRLKGLLAERGAHLDGIYFCPHHPTEGKPPYLLDCGCRKPETGMLEKASADLGIDLSCSYLVGDALTDMIAARRSGAKGILVLTGHGKRDLEAMEKDGLEGPDLVCPDILSAVDFIIAEESKRAV